VSSPPTACVVLVGFQDQDNLGLRYLSSRLRALGHQTRLVTVSQGPGPVLAAIQALQPHIVGFSLIFQYLVPQFASLLAQLRAAGVRAHFTMGGHYASFEPEVLLNTIPELDSVVLFEGEDTLLELAERVAAGHPWQEVSGIARRGPDGIVITPVRTGRRDLDALPWPDRDDIDYGAQPIPVASILGGRGCTWRCSFCSIINFYEGNGTPGRRRRDPQKVVDEIEYLHRQRGVRILLWQDDDFLTGGAAGVKWAHDLARECIVRGLHHNLRWKISCRSDEVRLETLEPLVEAGLTHVYLGVESGDPHDLKHLNKLFGPEAHLRAGEVLRRLGLSFDYGFMLLQPWSTLDTVRNNVTFLREFVGDGASPVVFCRTLPYAGTVIEARLKAEGRLLENNLAADYRFLDLRLDALYDWLLEAFGERNFGQSGMSRWLRSILFGTHLDLPDYPADPVLRARVHALTAVSNQIVLDTLESALNHVAGLSEVASDDPVLTQLARHAISEDRRLRNDVVRLIASRPNGALRAYMAR
jgi:anaerobic magnesium-protoporphyrin IX monomethyl ester cyclase